MRTPWSVAPQTARDTIVEACWSLRQHDGRSQSARPLRIRAILRLGASPSAWFLRWRVYCACFDGMFAECEPAGGFSQRFHLTGLRRCSGLGRRRLVQQPDSVRDGNCTGRVVSKFDAHGLVMCWLTTASWTSTGRADIERGSRLDSPSREARPHPVLLMCVKLYDWCIVIYSMLCVTLSFSTRKSRQPGAITVHRHLTTKTSAVQAPAQLCRLWAICPSEAACAG